MYVQRRKKILLVEKSGVEPLTFQLEQQPFTIVGLAPAIYLGQEYKTDSSSSVEHSKASWSLSDI